MQSKFFILFIAIILFIACKKQSDEIANSPVGKQEGSDEAILNYAIFFPDTVQIGNLNEGYIEFSNEFDTLTLEQGQMRFTNYYTITRSDPNFGDYAVLKRQNLDTFSAVNNKEIPIAIRFDRLGVNYVDGVFEDQVFIPTSDSSEVRMISIDARITFKSFVIDSIN